MRIFAHLDVRIGTQPHIRERAMSGHKRFSLERRPSGLAVIEEGQLGVSDLAVFYAADHQLALAVVQFLNGDMAEAERLRAEWMAQRYD
jgi:hypothetical protein